MSTAPEDLEEEPGDEDQPRMVQIPRKDIRALERQAKAADQARADAYAAQRELAFLKAGIPDVGPAKLLVEHYDGELTVEAIRAKAVEYGIIQDQPSVSADELAAVSRMANTASGAVPATGQPDIGAELIAAGRKSQAEVMEVVRRYGLQLPIAER